MRWARSVASTRDLQGARIRQVLRCLDIGKGAETDQREGSGGHGSGEGGDFQGQLQGKVGAASQCRATADPRREGRAKPGWYRLRSAASGHAKVPMLDLGACAKPLPKVMPGHAVTL